MTTGSVKVQFQFGTQAGEPVITKIVARVMKGGGQYGDDQIIDVTDNVPTTDNLTFSGLPYGDGYQIMAAAYDTSGGPAQAPWFSAPFTVGNIMQVIVVGGSVTPA